jgi:hypothetical protein
METYAKDLDPTKTFFKKFGSWNQYLFACLTGLAFVCTVASFASHQTIKKVDRIERSQLKRVEF